MDEDSSLPSLPGPPWSIAAPRGLSWMPRGARARRIEANLVCTNSSDPAVFSSDDDQALDNYHLGRRRKKRYVGAWYNQQPALSSDASMDSGFGGEEDVKTLRPPKRRAPSLEPSGPRKFKRQMDSGVWLPRGDMQSTDTEELEDVEMTPAPPKLLLRRPAMSEKEQLAQSLVQGCIELGIESVDLTYAQTILSACCWNSWLTRGVTALAASGIYPIPSWIPSPKSFLSPTLTGAYPFNKEIQKSDSSCPRTASNNFRSAFSTSST